MLEFQGNDALRQGMYSGGGIQSILEWLKKVGREPLICCFKVLTGHQQAVCLLQVPASSQDPQLPLLVYWPALRPLGCPSLCAHKRNLSDVC